MASPPTTASPDTYRVDGLEVHLREFRRGDEPQIVDVYRSAFGGFYPAAKPVDEYDYITWYAEPHDSHRVRCTVAEVGSRIVAASAGLRRHIKIGNVTLYGTAGGLGSATHEEFQHKRIGLARSRWNAATEFPPRTANIDARKPATRGRRIEPVPSNHRMGVHLKVLSPWRAPSHGVGVLSVPVYAAAAFWSRLRSATAAHPGIELETVGSFDQRFEPFLERATDGWDVMPLRSVEYLNWRFLDPRAGRFVARAALEHGKVVGYAVVHTVGTRGHVVDLLTEPDRLDVARALIGDAVDQLRRLGVWGIECWMLDGHPYVGLLRAAGFIRHPRRSSLMTDEIGWSGSGIGPRERALLNDPAARIHLVRTDFDWI